MKKDEHPKFLCGNCGELCEEYIYNEEKDIDECNDCKDEGEEINSF